MSSLPESSLLPIRIAGSLVGLIRDSITASVEGLLSEPLQSKVRMLDESIEFLHIAKIRVEVYQVVFQIGWNTSPIEAVQDVRVALTKVHERVQSLLVILEVIKRNKEQASEKSRIVWSNAQHRQIEDLLKHCVESITSLEGLCSEALEIRERTSLPRYGIKVVDDHNAAAESESEYWLDLKEITRRLGCHRASIREKLKAAGVVPKYPLKQKSKDNRTLFFRWGDVQLVVDGDVS